MKRFLTVFWKMFQARNSEFFRDREALGWNFIFPFLLIFGFAFMFRGGEDALFKVGVFPSSESLVTVQAKGLKEFSNTHHIQFISSPQLDVAIQKVQRHQIDLLVAVSPEWPAGRYWINSSSPKGYLLERLLTHFADGKMSGPERQIADGREIRYVDWLVAGILGMNMMFSALFGVGYVIVRYRKMGVLRRLKATPLNAFTFLLAQILSRYLLILGVTLIVYFGSHFFIHFQMFGTYFDLFFVLSLGAIALISLGLLIASRTSSEEFAGGLLNVLSWPMMFLSGVWFSLEGAHPWVQKLALAFPLTHVIQASRAIMTEGSTLAMQASHVYALVGMAIFFLLIGSLTFRWD